MIFYKAMTQKKNKPAPSISETPKIDSPKIETKIKTHKTTTSKDIDQDIDDILQVYDTKKKKTTPSTSETPKIETPKIESTKIETPKIETPKTETHKSNTSKNIDFDLDDILQGFDTKKKATASETPKIETTKNYTSKTFKEMLKQKELQFDVNTGKKHEVYSKTNQGKSINLDGDINVSSGTKSETKEDLLLKKIFAD